MDTTLADQAFSLRRRLEIWANDYYFLSDTKDRATELPPSLKDAFFSFISHLSLTLMEDEDNFFGYFFFQMGKELDLTLRAPTGVTFRGTKYILFFSPSCFWNRRRNRCSVQSVMKSCTSSSVISCAPGTFAVRTASWPSIWPWMPSSIRTSTRSRLTA